MTNASPPREKPDAALRERRELLLILGRQMTLVLAGNALVVPVCFGAMDLVSPTNDLRFWLAAMVGLIAVRWILLLRFRASSMKGHHDIHLWRMVFVLGSGASGCLYGLLGYIASDSSRPLSTIFVLMVLVGMTAGSIASLSAVEGAYPAFAVPTMSPIIFRHWEIGGVTGLTIAAFGVLFLAVNLGYARIQRRTLLESIRLRFEREELIQELESARQLSDAANEAKTRFLLSAGHDLRQPLYAIMLLIENMRRRAPAGAERETAALRTCARTIDDLLDRMLEIARMESGKAETHTEDTPLQSIFERLMTEFGPEAQAREIDVTCVATSLVIRTDAHLLTCILRNFLSNALRYSEGGKVLIGARRLGDRARIEVLDQGPGIAPEHMEAIFEPFYQVGNLERAPEKGHGLGLSIARGMATMMGARIDTRSRLGHGSAFGVTVEISAARLEAAAPTPVIAADAPLGAPLVLLVEDVTIVRETTRDLLEAWGCRVIDAVDGAQALSAVAQARDTLDCVITDLRLPGALDGLALVRELRRSTSTHLPAILITADPTASRGQTDGVIVLTKPVAPARLQETLLRVTRRREQARQP